MKQIVLKSLSLHWEFLKPLLIRCGDGFRLWMLTVTIPITCIILGLFALIFGAPIEKLNSLLYTVTVGYYYEYYFLDIQAWRIHLGILLFCILIAERK